MEKIITFREEHFPPREDFPVLSQLVHGRPLAYLDNAATTLKPLKVIEALQHYYRHLSANIHRGHHHLSEESTILYEATRTAAQHFLHARHPEEIIFTKGTTEGINLVASSFAKAFLNPGDEILLTAMEHHSNIVPWQLAGEPSQAKIQVIPINDQGEIILEEVERLLTKKTKIIAITHISNVLGTINPIKKIIAMAHAAGAKVLIDAAQSVAHMPLDVQDLDADFVVFSAHKMLGPTGLGVLYGKRELLEVMPPYQGGGNMIHQVSFEKTTYQDLPHKFEAGTPAIAQVIAFNESIKYLLDIGLEKIERREHKLLQFAHERLESIKGLIIWGRAKEKSAILSFTHPALHHQDFGDILNQQGIAIRTGHHCCMPLMKRLGITGTARASLAFYNTEEEIISLAIGIEKALKFT